MNLNRVRIGVFCTAALASSSLLPGQMGSMPSQQGQPNQPNQPQSSAPDGGMSGAMTGEAGADSSQEQSMRDQMFVRNAAEGGLAEVQMGQLAAQKGSSDEVKSFGQKMAQDHTMLNNSMKPVADSMDVRVPTKLNKKDQAEYDRLNGLSGADFDSAYLTDMVKDHHKDLRDFQAENSTVMNPTLKAAVQKGEQVIQQHTQMVDQLAKSKGLAVPAHGGR
jgi:putative membrane protein